jgi:uncharacterized membrane protein YagU involved in acid resistance
VHLTIGCAVATVYGLLAPKRLSTVAATTAGALYGVLVWLTSYGKLLPELGLMPTPNADERRRPQAMVVGHVIYGSIVGALISAPRSREKIVAE